MVMEVKFFFLEWAILEYTCLQENNILSKVFKSASSPVYSKKTVLWNWLKGNPQKVIFLKGRAT